MVWVYALVLMFVCLAAIEWTSRPRRRPKDESTGELQQRIPSRASRPATAP